MHCYVYVCTRIIPQHLADLKQFSKCTRMETGNFTVSITGRRWYSVAFDEAHEICINIDVKTAITQQSLGYLQKTSLFSVIVLKHSKIYYKSYSRETQRTHKS